MRRKFCRGRTALLPFEQREQAGQVRKVAGDQDVTTFVAQPIANPRGWVVGLQIASGRELRERVACAPERFRCLPGAELAAVPDDDRFDAPPSGFIGEPIDAIAPGRRERPLRIDFGSNRLTVVNQNEGHEAAIRRRDPAGVGTLSRRREYEPSGDSRGAAGGTSCTG